MILDTRSFSVIADALVDRFRTYDQLSVMSRHCHGSLGAIVEENTVEFAIKALVEDVASKDRLEEFIACLRKRYGENRRIADLDFSGLAGLPSSEAVVNEEAGGPNFKKRLRVAMSEIEDPMMFLQAEQEVRELIETATASEARTVFRVTLGLLKVDRERNTGDALARLLAESLKKAIGNQSRPDSLVLDLDRTRLKRVDLEGLDLHEADVAFADLQHCNLDNANLWRSKGYAVNVSKSGLTGANLEEARWHSAIAQKTRFHDCRMTSIVLKEANLEGAEFQQSRLQGAHLERSILSGARFEGANLADTYFMDAEIDDTAARSISRALNWGDAHLDSDVRASVEAYARGE